MRKQHSFINSFILLLLPAFYAFLPFFHQIQPFFSCFSLSSLSFCT